MRRPYVNTGENLPKPMIFNILTLAYLIPVYYNEKSKQDSYSPITYKMGFFK